MAQCHSQLNRLLVTAVAGHWRLSATLFRANIEQQGHSTPEVSGDLAKRYFCKYIVTQCFSIGYTVSGA